MQRPRPHPWAPSRKAVSRNTVAAAAGESPGPGQAQRDEPPPRRRHLPPATSSASPTSSCPRCVSRASIPPRDPHLGSATFSSRAARDGAMMGRIFDCWPPAPPPIVARRRATVSLTRPPPTSPSSSSQRRRRRCRPGGEDATADIKSKEWLKTHLPGDHCPRAQGAPRKPARSRRAATRPPSRDRPRSYPGRTDLARPGRSRRVPRRGVDKARIGEIFPATARIATSSRSAWRAGSSPVGRFSKTTRVSRPVSFFAASRTAK